MELAVAKQDSGMTVADAVFGAAFNSSLVHQVVTAYMAAGRAGTKAQKTRADVRGGGRKPWRQKGTGRARAGTIRSPLWQGGGVVFAARPRGFAQKVNRKMYRGAMRSIFSELARQDRLVVVNDLNVAERKTRALLASLNDLGVADAAVRRRLLLVEKADDNLIYSARNVPHLAVASVSQVDPVTLVGADQVIATADALKRIEEWLG